jgi:hypothetical protein
MAFAARRYGIPRIRHATGSFCFRSFDVKLQHLTLYTFININLQQQNNNNNNIINTNYYTTRYKNE